jgi:hypothetical protein
VVFDPTWNWSIGRVNVVFALAGGDVAVNTLHVITTNDSNDSGITTTVDDLEALMTTIRGEYAAFYGGNGAFYQGCVLSHLDGYVLNSAAPHKALAKVSLGTSGEAGTASQALPPECAVCVSLYGYARNSFVPDARRKRGRLYLPGLSTPYLTSEGLLGTGGTGAIATFGQGLAEALWDTELDSDHRGQLVIASRTGNLLSPVSYVRVDNHVDVQRRRQNAMPYAYTYLDVAYTG